nr:hypothetical protein [Burkholderia sp. BCC1993]
MSLDQAAECSADTSCDAVVTADARATKHRAGHSDGRSRRFRIGDAIEDAPARTVTGSIAISFAVVSRRNWPR